MAKTVRIYHNPRCGKSRETLALLQARGIDPEVIEYLKAPPRVIRAGLRMGRMSSRILRFMKPAKVLVARSIAFSTPCSVRTLAASKRPRAA